MSTKRERDDGSDSEGEDSLGGVQGGVREGKRKVNRACDSCRKKRHRCDGDSSGASCSTCQSFNLQCTYLESSNRKAVPKGYVEALEARIATLMSIVSKDRADVDLERLFGGPLLLDPALFNVRHPAGQNKRKFPPLDNDSSDVSSVVHPIQRPSSSGPPVLGSSVTGQGLAASKAVPTTASAGPSSLTNRPVRGPPRSSGRDEPETPKERGDSEDELIRQFVRLDRPDEIAFRSFLGKASSLPLMRSSIEFKYGANASRFSHECALHPLAMELQYQTPMWEHPPNLSFPRGGSVYDSWPDPALAASLIELYFDHANEALPLLQKAHFLRQYASQLYFRDEGFARICLLVFARGSGYSPDRRVLSINEDGEYEPFTSAGWIYYHTIGKIPNSCLKHTVLADLQFAVLHASFLQVHGSRPTRPWPIIGAGLKAAIEVGAHRRGATRSRDSKDNELMRRAFWCLYLLDVEYSSALGRPLTLNEDEFDVELDFDLTFWQDGVEAQPQGHPSALKAFCLEAELAKILARTITLLYGIKRPHKSSLVIMRDLEEQIKGWHATIPPYLRWDPSRPNSLEFRLSAHLRMLLEKTRTYIHRPFLPSPEHPVSASPASITAAYQAALASVAVYDELYSRTREISQGSFSIPHNSATILLITVWAGPATHEFADPAEAMEAVEKALWHMQHIVKRFIGLQDAVVPTSVLAAPRVDYLVESVAKRQHRERRVAHALELQQRKRMLTAERLSQSPPPALSPSATMYGSSASDSPHGSGGEVRSPSTGTTSDTYGGQMNTTPATPLDILDLFQLGSDFMFPDLASDHDPAMTLFLSSPQQQQQQPPSTSFQVDLHPYPMSQPSNFYGGGGSSWNSGGPPSSGLP